MVAPEKLVMRACSKSLIDSLAEEDIDSIADDLHSRKLISNDVKEALALPKTKKVKAREGLIHEGELRTLPGGQLQVGLQGLFGWQVPLAAALHRSSPVWSEPRTLLCLGRTLVVQCDIYCCQMYPFLMSIKN